jgi:hypothetical protein
VEAYLSFRPDLAEAPSAVRRASERGDELKRQFIATSSDSASVATGEPAPALGVDKSLSSFNSTVCKMFTEGYDRYTPITCYHSSFASWSCSGNSMSVNTEYNGEDFDGIDYLHFYDRSYHWNVSSQTGHIAWWNYYADPPGTPYAASVQYTIPANWWTWMSVYGSTGASFTGETWNGSATELGITYHRYSNLIH